MAAGPGHVLSRREWLARAGALAGGGALLAGGETLLAARGVLAEDAAPPPGGEPARAPATPHEASWYDRLDGSRVRCRLCPRACEVADGGRGLCGVRENRGGKYYTLVWGAPCALHVDPIEKKPFFHFKPGTTVLSLATAGCNLMCRFCQNWNISQARPEDVESTSLPPDGVVALARRERTPGIAFTYTEPTVFSEYVRDTAALARGTVAAVGEAREAGLDVVTVSNGFIEEAPLRELLKVLSAVKIDLKAFTDRFYRELCGGASLAPVKKSLETVAQSGVWLEIVNLVIPTWNDSESEVREMARWIAKTLGRDVPLHFSRFHPTYRLQNLPVTPVSTVSRAREAALAEGLRYVYVGNVPGHEGENTYCPKCKAAVVQRTGFAVVKTALAVKDGRASCEACGEVIPGRF